MPPASSGGASSTPATAISFTGLPDPGTNIPLDNLCVYLQIGVWRLFENMARQESSDCTPAFTSEAAYHLTLIGDLRSQAEAVCLTSGTDGGDRTMDDIRASIAAGRVIYHGDRAAACVAAGRASFRFVNGDFITDGGSVDTLASCAGALEGLQGANQPCAHQIECSTGLDCVGRTGASCQGTCQPHGSAGAPCDNGWPSCREGFDCVQQHCMARPARGQPCAFDGGTVSCLDGVCTGDGVCGDPKPLGSTCHSSDGCQRGLRCQSDRCTALPGPGAACATVPDLDDTSISLGDSDCAPCLECFRRAVAVGQDGGQATCQPFAGLGEACVDRPCHLGLACAGGQCVQRVGHGELCRTDVPGRMGRGNCLIIGEVCAGSPARCGPRLSSGQPCSSVGRTPGECADSLACALATSGATTGTCLPRPGPGEACGSGVGLVAECRDVSSAALTCRSGQCVFSSSGPLGAPCQDGYACDDGLACRPGDGGAGQCIGAGAPGDPCGTTQPWGSVCAVGTCRSPGDGGPNRCGVTATGAVCSFTSECGPDDWCERGDAGFRCARRVTEGATCRDDDQCGSGLVCRAGVCRSAACDVPLSAAVSCADTGLIPVLLAFGMVLTPSWRRRRGSSGDTRGGAA